MKAVTVAPGMAGSVRLEEVPEPDASLGSVVVEALAVGICGTDAEIASGSYGWAPPGRDRLILGHESLGRVVDPGPSGFAVGEHVVGIVRRPDPAPCPNCAVGEWDMCSNGGYTERGIKQADGFMAERWRIEMVFSQLAKGPVRPVCGGGQDVADLDLVVGDDDAVDEQFGQLPPLGEGGGGQPGPDGLAEPLDPVGDGGEFQPLLGSGLQLSLLGGQGGLAAV